MEREISEGTALSADWRQRLDPTGRFSARAGLYRDSRPHYPAEIVTILRQQCGLTEGSLVVDVGAGTGLLTELFLENGNSVIAVEPNAGMRGVLTGLQSSYPKLAPLAATAEAIPIENHSVDFVTAGTAFHWFDLEAVREEFPRILKPDGWAVIVVNDRCLGPEPFLAEYEQLILRFGARDYPEVKKRHDPKREEAFFAPGGCRTLILENRQRMDLAAFEGRILSSSFMPLPGEAPELHEEIAGLFERNQKEGRVEIRYDCRMRYGRLRKQV